MFRQLIACTGIFLASGSAFAQQETYRPNDKVPRAIAAQVTDGGFDALESTAQALVPTLLADGFALDDISVGNSTFGLELAGLKPVLSVRELDIVPVTPDFAGAELQVFTTIDLGLNSSTEPYYLRVSALFDACDGNGWLNNVVVKVGNQTKGGIPLEINVVDGQFEIDANIPSNIITLRNPDAGGECGGLLEFILTSFSDVIIDAVVIPEVQKLLRGDGQNPGLIDDLNASLGAASIAMVGDDAIDVLGKKLNVELTPRNAATSPDGLELVYDSRITAAVDACIEDDPLGSLKLGTAIPPISAENAQIGANISADMANQALYAVYTGGLLCLDVASLVDPETIPIPINDELIYLIGGDGFKEVVTPGAPISLVTQPTAVPTVSFDGASDIEVLVDDLEINIYSDVMGRQARVIAVAADATAGVNLDFDGMTGALGIGLNLDDAFTFTSVGDEFVAGSGADIAEGLGGLVDQLLGLLLPSLLGDLAFELPSISGIGLQSLSFSALGDQGQWLNGDANIGLVTYGSADGGCGGCGGDTGGDASCGGGGCSQGAAFNLGTYLLVLLPLVGLRRRRS